MSCSFTGLSIFRFGRVASSKLALWACVASALLTAVTAHAADGDFAWASALGGSAFEAVNNVTVDGAGNVYTTGYFLLSADFDPDAVDTFELFSAGSRDIFISKLDSNGDFVWARRIGGTGNDESYSVVVDAAGNVYTTGYFEGTVDFDPGVGTSNLTTAGGTDTFVLKLDSNGDFVWAKSIRGTNNSGGIGIALDNSGNVHTVGYFSGTVDFDPGAGTINLASAGSFDVFVLKLDNSGDYVWAKRMGRTLSDFPSAIALDASGNVHTTGTFEGTNVDFDPGVGTAYLSSAGSKDIFVSKLDSSGDFVWAKKLGGTDFDYVNSIAVDASENVYTAGRFKSTADFDPGAGASNLTSAGDADIFVSKLDSSGDFVWAKRMGGTGYDEANGIALDALGNVYTAGEYLGTADFDPGAGTSELTSAGNRDIFVSKLDSSGDFVWAQGLGSTGSDRSDAMAADASGNVYATGTFQSTVDFDPGAGTSNLTSVGSSDIFVLSISGPDLTPPNATAITPATTGPTNATSVDFTVTFDEDVQNFDDDVVVTHSGTAHTGVSIAGSGATYTVTIEGLSGDGTFTVAVDTGGDVQDLAGNALASSVTSAAVSIDSVDPVFSNLTVMPEEASVGELIAITFDSSESTAGDPDVSVNGNPATQSGKAAHTYQYTILPSDPLGPATIEISGVDDAGNAGMLSSSTALVIVEPAPAVPVTAWPLAVALGAIAATVLRRKRRY